MIRIPISLRLRGEPRRGIIAGVLSRSLGRSIQPVTAHEAQVQMVFPQRKRRPPALNHSSAGRRHRPLASGTSEGLGYSPAGPCKQRRYALAQHRPPAGPHTRPVRCARLAGTVSTIAPLGGFHCEVSRRMNPFASHAGPGSICHG
jgi:hypothetical protein